MSQWFVDILKQYLVYLFHLIFENGIYPTNWCIAIIMPLHKDGLVNNVENYRGISSLAYVSKLFTSIINDIILLLA